MTDPYGALATQRKGDFGIFDGAQWHPSSTGANVFGKSVAKANLYHGSTNAPVRNLEPSFQVNRTELIASGVSPNPIDPFYNAAIIAVDYSLVGNKVQPTAIYGIAYGEVSAGNYSIGVFAEGDQSSGVGGAMGVFALAQATTANSVSIVGVNPTIEVLNGINYPWSGGGASFGVDIDIETGGATNYASAAVGIRTGGGALWDVGVGIASTANIRTAGFEDDSASPTVLKVTGSHTNGIDVSGATFSGSAIKLPALTSYTPTVGGAGITGTATGAYLQLGKMLYVRVEVTITAGAGGTPTFTIPAVGAAGAVQILAGRENAVTGAMLQGLVFNSNVVTIVTYANASPVPGGTGTCELNGFIEIS